MLQFTAKNPYNTIIHEKIETRILAGHEQVTTCVVQKHYSGPNPSLMNQCLVINNKNINAQTMNNTVCVLRADCTGSR